MNEEVRASIKRVLDTVPDPASKGLVSDLLRLSLNALQDLANLDESILAYVDADMQSHKVNDDAPSGVLLSMDMLRDVHGKAFRGLREVKAFVSNRGVVQGEDEGQDEPIDTDFDFDFGEGDRTSRSPGASLASLDEGDIDKAFELLSGDEEEVNISEKLNAFREEISGLGHMLCEQLDHYEQRIGAALEGGQSNAVLRELDEARESLTEGLFAIVTTTFELFLGEVDRARLLPGYKDALEQCLMIRRGLTDLTRVVRAENDWIIQDGGLPEVTRRESIGRLASELTEFMANDVFKAMRAPDRVEFASFLKRIRSNPPNEARVACEGLSKYLESLSAMNQRDVLLQHDQETIGEVKQSLEAARSLLQVSFFQSRSLLQEALGQLDDLYGRNPALDEQIDAWRVEPGIFETRDGLQEAIARLEELVR